MKAVAIAAGVLFGLAHLVAGVQLLNSPDAERGSGQPGAVPHNARFAMVAASVLVILGAAAQSLALLVLGLVGSVGLAVYNGVWMHGRPTPKHHAVRVVVAVVVLVLFLSY